MGRIPAPGPGSRGRASFPGRRHSDISGKTLAHLDAGVRAVWIVGPRRRIVTVHTPGGLAGVLPEGDELTGGDIVPGFVAPVDELFTWDELRRKESGACSSRVD